MADAPLYIIRAELDRAALFALARQRRLPLRDIDLGYLVHCALRGTFGDHAPQPFSVDDGGRTLTLLGYGAHPADVMLARARTAPDPQTRAVWRDEALRAKPMPTVFPPGTRFRFAVRICPVLRKAAAGEKHRKGAELDVFLARGWQAGPDVVLDREAVYRDWLAERLAAGGAATLVRAAMHAFRRERVVRSRHGNGNGGPMRRCERPDAQFRGILEVGDSAAFAALLRRGIGRHRAFGFGMLLLRRESSAC